MLDTNILISIAIFNSDILKKMLISICDKHTLMLSTQIIKELKEVVKRKFPNKINNMNQFLYQLPYELVHISNAIIKNNRIYIRDIEDLPILNSAIESDIDIFITGDKDFKDVKINKPKIMTATEFLEKYC